MTWFHLGGCSKCGGDLAYDDGDWICLQCGTYFYTGLYRREETAPEDERFTRLAAALLAPGPGQRADGGTAGPHASKAS